VTKEFHLCMGCAVICIIPFFAVVERALTFQNKKLLYKCVFTEVDKRPIVNLHMAKWPPTMKTNSIPNSYKQ
jgi:hypothetical protein